MWLADGRSDNGCFHSRIRENGRAAAKREGDPVEGNPVEVELGWPRCVHPHRRGRRLRSSPLRLFFLSLAHTSLRPLDGFNLLPFPFFLSLSRLLSRARFKTDFLFGPFDSLILSSLFLSLFPFSFRPSPRHSLYRCLPHLLVAEDEERGGDGDLEREEPKSSVVAAAMVRTKNGQKGKRRTRLLTKGLNNES